MPTRTSVVSLLCLSATLVAVRTAAAEDWLPVSPEELHMTSEPQAPGAPAVFLYRQVDRSDRANDERTYVRIKILTEEGLKYANVDIPYRENESIRFLEARSIRPDGGVENFGGTVYEKQLVKVRNAKLLTKTFTLPDIQVGSIIEYRYTRGLAYGWVFDSRWILSEELFTKHAKFSLVPNDRFLLEWTWPRGVPPGTDAPKNDHGTIRLETHDVPAFVVEEHMPPDNELRYRVEFIYDADQTPRKDPDAFWKQRGKQLYGSLQRFIDERRAMEAAVASVVSPADAPEAKLRKLYVRTQQIRNLSFESESEREALQQERDSIKDVADVWKKGYGDGRQITWLLLALTRAAGIEAYPVLVSTRDTHLFDPRLMNPGELNSNLVLVKLDGKDVYLDPGIPFTPFGFLPWNETLVAGLRLDKDGGSWLRTPAPASAESRTERKASLKFDRGTLDGKVIVTYTGLEASWRRLQERREDTAARRKFLEDELQAAIPTGTNVKLTNSPDWTSWDAPLVAEYELEVPGWAAGAGRRALVPVGLFGAEEKHTFEHATRVQPLYFDYPYQHFDDVTIDLPSPWVVDSVPRSRTLDLKGVLYKSTAENLRQSLHVTREIDLNVSLVDVRSYDSMRQFYQTVRTGDEEQAIVSPSAGPLRQ